MATSLLHIYNIYKGAKETTTFIHSRRQQVRLSTKYKRFFLNKTKKKMVREVNFLSARADPSLDEISAKLAADDGIHVDELPIKDDLTIKHRVSITDDESGFSEVSTLSARASPVQSIVEDDYQLASQIPDETKKEFCSDMSLVFHAEFQLTFGRYFTSDHWILMPLNVEGACKLPTDCSCDVEIAKVRFECEQCGHCWTSMRGQISFFFDSQTHVLYFKLFNQHCDQCGCSSVPLWYPEEVCRVMKNVFTIVHQQLYPELITPIKPNHYRRFGNPKGQHHGCESCRDGVCVALAAQQLGCKLVK